MQNYKIFFFTFFHFPSLQWSEIENMNVADVEDEFKKRLENIAINECCCLVYTVSFYLLDFLIIFYLSNEKTSVISSKYLFAKLIFLSFLCVVWYCWYAKGCYVES